MAFFAAGIAWDPREPLPPEYTHLGEQPHIGAYHTHIQTKIRAPFAIGGQPPSDVSFKELPDHVVRESTRNILPPLSISIDGRIVGDTAKVKVSQVFWNNADLPIPQASYVFPLPNGCTITSFSCRVGRDKVLRAKVKPKEEARKAFQEAVANHNTTALLEQNTPEIFTASLGYIPANTRLEAELTYVTTLKRQFSQEKNITVFSIPTAIANRYGHAPTDIAGIVQGKEPGSFTLQLEVMDADKIIQIKSETHKVILDQGLLGGKASSWNDLSGQSGQSYTDVAVVTLDSEVGYLREDFILTIETRSPSKADGTHAWIESHPSLRNQKAVMITIPSSFMEDKAALQTGEVIFLVDRSGSMVDKIDAVKSSLRFFLKGIPVGRKFNIWSFGSSYERLWPTSQEYSAESLRVAMDHVERHLKADMGGTELLRALEAMLQSRDSSCPCDVVILTDGQVWRLDETLSLVQHTRVVSQGEVRFFSLGIGAHVSHALVQGIASRGGGYSEVIPKASLGGWEDRLVSMLKAALTRHIDTLAIKVNGKDVSDGYLTSPAELGYFNPFQSNRIYLLAKPNTSLDEPRNITIETMKPKGVNDITDVAMTAIQAPDTTIHSLAARAILDEVEFATNGVPLPNKDKRPLGQAQAEELGCRFSLVSKWTSLFLEQKNNEFGEDGQLIRSIPAQDATGGLVLLQRRGTSRHLLPESNRVPGGERSIVGPGISSAAHELTIEGGRRDASRRPLKGFIPSTSLEAFAEGFSHLLETSTPPFPPYTFRDEPRLAGTSGDKSTSDKDRAKQQFDERLPSMIQTDDAELADTALGRHKKFVADLLTYQNFDGSIKVDASSILGPSLAGVAQEVETHMLQNNSSSGTSAALLAYTVIVVALLERDLQDCRDLWYLMIEKAVRYIATQVSDGSVIADLMAFAAERLDGKELPSPASSTESTPQVTQDTGGQPERVVVEVAPI
ncbi:von Willebrand factor type A domain-containing protein, partial [Hypoxylon sp. FL0543]